MSDRKNEPRSASRRLVTVNKGHNDISNSAKYVARYEISPGFLGCKFGNKFCVPGYPLVIKHGNRKATRNWGFNMKITCKWSIFHCHVWLPEGNLQWFVHSLLISGVVAMMGFCRNEESKWISGVDWLTFLQPEALIIWSCQPNTELICCTLLGKKRQTHTSWSCKWLSIL